MESGTNQGAAALNHPKQRLMTVSQACNRGGFSRSTFYVHAGKGKSFRVVKLGARTLVDVESFDAYLDALPKAQIGVAGKID